MTLIPLIVLLAGLSRAANTIYLVGADPNPSQKVLLAVAHKATADFAALGLRTQVRLLKGELDEESYRRLDKTDSAAFFGTPEHVLAAVRKVNPGAAKSMEQAAFGSNSGSINPEHSLNPRDGHGSNIIGVALGATKTFSEAVGVSVVEGAAFMIVHGAGHNANLQHAGDSNGFEPATNRYVQEGLWVPHTPNIMTDGGVIVGRIETQAFGLKEGKSKETLQSFIDAKANTAPADPKERFLSIKAALIARFDKDAPKASLPVVEPK